jgi:hypothetical protein
VCYGRHCRTFECVSWFLYYKNRTSKLKSLIFTELFKYSVIIILHNKFYTIKKCWFAFCRMWSCEILLYYSAWLKQKKLNVFFYLLHQQSTCVHFCH